MANAQTNWARSRLILSFLPPILVALARSSASSSAAAAARSA